MNYWSDFRLFGLISLVLTYIGLYKHVNHLFAMCVYTLKV